MEKIICPICRSKEVDFFCDKNGYKLYRCLSCRLIFVWPIPGNLSEIYSAPYFKRVAGGRSASKFGYVDYEEDKKATRETFIVYLDKISKLTAGLSGLPAGRQGRKIFDIGAATGYFLDLARQAGWQTSGIEISEYAAKIARAKGHQIFLGDLENLDNKEKYDAVTMWDVLEHLADPVKYLKLINNFLNQAGVLAINTIDSGSLWAKLWGGNWHAILPPEHLFYYSAESLKILLKQSGFEISEQLKIGKKFTLPYICKVLSHRYNLPCLGKLSDFLNKAGFKIGLPINLRDNIFIIAKKIRT